MNKHILIPLFAAVFIINSIVVRVPQASASVPSVCANGVTIYSQDVHNFSDYSFPDDRATIRDWNGAVLLQIPQINDMYVIWPTSTDIEVITGDILSYSGVFNNPEHGHSLTLQLFDESGAFLNTLNFVGDVQNYTVTQNGTIRFPAGIHAWEKNYLTLCPAASPNPQPQPQPIPQIPAMPTNLSATPISASQINISWTDSSTNETGFRVERYNSNSSSWNTLTTLPANSSSYQDTNLLANTSYSYRVIATGPNGNSQPTPYVVATTFAGQTQTQAPTVATQSATNIGQSNGTLNASINPNGAQTSGWFEYGITASFGQTTGQQSLGNGTVTSVLTFSVTGLQNATTYYYRAVAQNGSGTTQGSTLSFTTTGTVCCQNNQGAPIISSSQANSQNNNSVYFTASVNPNGANTTVWFEYGQNNNFGNSSPTQSIGSGNGQTSANVTVQNLNSNTTYTFRAVAQNSFGTSYGQTQTFYTQNNNNGNCYPYNSYNCNNNQLIITTNAATNLTGNSATLNALIQANQNNNGQNYGVSTSAWFEYGTTPSLGATVGSQNLGGGSNSTPYSFTINNLNQNSTYYFRAVAQNSNGIIYGSTLSFNTSIGFGGGNFGTAQATTLGAEYITQTSALLKATINTQNNAATARFEWGTTAALGQTTPAQTLSASNTDQPFSFFASALQPNTTYFYRIVVDTSSYSTNRINGQILSFITRSVVAPVYSAPVTNIVYASNPTPTPVEEVRASLILTASVNSPSANRGDEITYALNYRNVSDSQRLRGLELMVTLPKDTTFISANYPTYQLGNVLTFNKFDMAPQSESTALIKVRVNDSAQNGDTLVLNAVINYFDARNKPHSVSAFSTVSVGGSTLSGNNNRGLTAFFADTNISLGWLLVIAGIILLAILAARRLMSREPYQPRGTPRSFRDEDMHS